MWNETKNKIGALMEDSLFFQSGYSFFISNGFCRPMHGSSEPWSYYSFNHHQSSSQKLFC